MERLTELEQTARQLDPGADTRIEISTKAGGYIHNFLESLPEMPGYTTGNFRQLEAMVLEETGKPIEALLDVLKNEVDSTGINTSSGRHLGFIPGGGLWASSIADMLAAVTNRYAGIVYSNPGAVKIERQLIDWMVSLVGYPQMGYGNLTSGGSVANLIAVKAARDHHGINAANVKNSVIYFGEQTHHCILKALHITGLYEAVLRPVALDNRFRMDAAALRAQMAADRENGLQPFLVIATAGTTDTGAVDPLDAIADACAAFGAWFHVDAAYGGFFMLLDDMKGLFKGIERSDSVVLDPHKTLFIPYGSGAVLLRDRSILLASNAHTGAYMHDTHGLEDINPADTGVELTRHNRGLRMWLPLHLHGLGPFRAALQEKLLLCRYFHQSIAALGFETATDPDLTVSVFRWPGDDDNSFNQLLIDAVHADGTVFLSSTKIYNKLWIRCAIVSHRTHLREMDLALQMIRNCLQKVNNSGAQLNKE